MADRNEVARVFVSVRMSKESIAAYQELTGPLDRKRSQLIRQALQEFLERHGKSVEV
jgi:predicted transcriptional regulator